MDDEPPDPGESGGDSAGAASPPGEGDDGRRCTNCGAPLNRYSKFCTECGTEQSEAGDDDMQQQGSDWQQGEQSWGDEQDNSGWQQGGPGGQQRGGRQGGPGRQQQGGRQGGPGRQQRGGQQGRPGGQQRGQQGRGRQPDRMQRAARDSNTGLAAVSHVLALFLGLIGPILIYAITDDPFVRENAANATNWQIMVLVYGFVSGILVLVLIGFLFLLALIVANFVFVVIAAIKASNGEAWEYPLTPELL
jgi:uncharacterized Tic20 family protein